MFFKTALTFLAVGALSVNALTAPVARSPAPEPESLRNVVIARGPIEPQPDSGLGKPGQYFDIVKKVWVDRARGLSKPVKLSHQ